MNNADWSIRSLLNPVTTRLLIYGINPMDLEYVMTQVENMVLLNTRSLEERWQSLWEQKATTYDDLASKALAKGHHETARDLYMATAQCYFAIYLINLSSLEAKASIYNKLSESYYQATRLFPGAVEKVSIAFSEGQSIAAYLHLPPSDKTAKGAVVFYAGLGSCKEEMNTLARTLVERGIAVLVPDMPGCGDTLFTQKIACSVEKVNKVYALALDYLKHHKKTRELTIGCAGLCMGGGYAYNAAILNTGYRFCATLFPLFIAQVSTANTPQWMRSGPWYELQTDNAEPEAFQASMARASSGKLSCPFYLVHGKYDNWMTLDKAMELYNIAENPVKEKLIIQQEPLFSKGETLLHTMPVGEQMHWVRHLFADWILEQTGLPF